jgi:hypothetical protein
VSRGPRQWIRARPGDWLVVAPGPAALPIILLLAFLLAFALDGAVGFEDARLGAGIGLVGTVVLGWPGLRLNAQAFHRRKMIDLESRLAAMAEDIGAGSTQVLKDIAAELQIEIDKERKAASDWSTSAAVCLFVGYLLVLCAGLGDVLLA